MLKCAEIPLQKPASFASGESKPHISYQGVSCWDNYWPTVECVLQKILVRRTGRSHVSLPWKQPFGKQPRKINRSNPIGLSRTGIKESANRTWWRQKMLTRYQLGWGENRLSRHIHAWIFLGNQRYDSSTATKAMWSCSTESVSSATGTLNKINDWH